MKKIVGQVTEAERDEIQRLFKRRNGLTTVNSSMGPQGPPNLATYIEFYDNYILWGRYERLDVWKIRLISTLVMKITKLTTLISIIILLAACSEDNWFYNGVLGDCPWCENGLLEDLRDCPHCDNGILTPQSCGSCHGFGQLKCTWCNGFGGEWVLGADGNDHFEDCKSCNGYGWEMCNVCNGKGYYFIDEFGYRSPF